MIYALTWTDSNILSDDQWGKCCPCSHLERSRRAPKLHAIYWEGPPGRHLNTVPFFQGMAFSFHVKNSPCCGQPRCQLLGGHTPTKLTGEWHLPHNESTFANSEKPARQAGLPGGSAVTSLPAMQETQVQALVQGGSLQKEMATHSRILTWEIPWTEEPGGLHSRGYQKN